MSVAEVTAQDLWSVDLYLLWLSSTYANRINNCVDKRKLCNDEVLKIQFCCMIMWPDGADLVMHEVFLIRRFSSHYITFCLFSHTAFLCSLVTVMPCVSVNMLRQAQCLVALLLAYLAITHSIQIPPTNYYCNTIVHMRCLSTLHLYFGLWLCTQQKYWCFIQAAGLLHYLYPWILQALALSFKLWIPQVSLWMIMTPTCSQHLFHVVMYLYYSMYFYNSNKVYHVYPGYSTWHWQDSSLCHGSVWQCWFG